jgi:hypothetical protein
MTSLLVAAAKRMSWHHNVAPAGFPTMTKSALIQCEPDASRGFSRLQAKRGGAVVLKFKKVNNGPALDCAIQEMKSLVYTLLLTQPLLLLVAIVFDLFLRYVLLIPMLPAIAINVFSILGLLSVNPHVLWEFVLNLTMFIRLALLGLFPDPSGEHSFGVVLMLSSWLLQNLPGLPKHLSFLTYRKISLPGSHLVLADQGLMALDPMTGISTLFIGDVSLMIDEEGTISKDVWLPCQVGKNIELHGVRQGMHMTAFMDESGKIHSWPCRADVVHIKGLWFQERTLLGIAEDALPALHHAPDLDVVLILDIVNGERSLSVVVPDSALDEQVRAASDAISSASLLKLVQIHMKDKLDVDCLKDVQIRSFETTCTWPQDNVMTVGVEVKADLDYVQDNEQSFIE